MKQLRSTALSLPLAILILALSCAQDDNKSAVIAVDVPSASQSTKPQASAGATTASSSTQPASTRASTRASRTSRPVVAKWSMRPLPKDEVNLLVFGDFANGKDQQKVVAKAMADYVQKTGVQFNALLTLGDNFYVRLRNADDYQFQSLFEDMYDAKILNFPFYLTAGNHDYEPSQPNRLRGERYKFEIEMEYARRRPDSRLKYPSRWYRLDFPQGSISRPGLVTVLMLESDKPHLSPQQWDQQKRWIGEQLASTDPNTTWTLACAHHPLFSNGAHGDNGVMQVEWGPIFKSHNLDFYCGGHDHDLQHLQVSGFSTTFVQAGGGGQGITDMRRDNRGPFSKKLHGFAHLRLTPDLAHVKYIDAAQAKVVHHFTKDRHNNVKIIYTVGKDKATTKPLRILLGLPDTGTKPSTTQATSMTGD